MKFNFETYDEFADLWQSVHDSIIYWKKVRQDAQGKICLQVNGEKTHYTEEYANCQLARNAKILKDIEDSTRPEWNGTEYALVEGTDCYSGIITEFLREGVAS